MIPPLKDYLWGGTKLKEKYRKETDLPTVAESWELACREDGRSTIENGPAAGMDLARYIATEGDRVTGTHAARFLYFPILIKMIDTAQDLSIQVHPTDELAAITNPGQKGKTEMWYVVGADKGAKLLSGLTQEITPDEYEEKVNDKTITDVLGRYDVRPGDVFFLPAGRIHAIGAGSFVAEIQQTSDITYRIYDYGRLGLDGRPRELHLEKAKEAIDYTVFPDYRTNYVPVKNEETRLVSCKYFTTSLFDIDKPVSKNLSALDSFVVVICVSGKGELVDNERDGSVHRLEVRQGETVLVPASSNTIEFHPDGAMTCLTSFIE